MRVGCGSSKNPLHGDVVTHVRDRDEGEQADAHRVVSLALGLRIDEHVHLHLTGTSWVSR